MAISTVAAFGQGKVNFQLDGYSLIVLNDCGHLLWIDCSLAGQAVPNAGPLPSGIFLKAGLYAGTSSTSLALVTNVVINPSGGSGQPAGYIPPTHVILPFPGGSLAYMQVKVWDAAYASYEEQWAACPGAFYATWDNIFTMTPGTSISYPPITGGGGSTWAAVGNDTPIIVPGWLDAPGCLAIVTQPASQTVAQGGTATFSVYARSYWPLLYQWFFNNASIPDATNSWYTITNVQPSNAGTYMVHLRNVGSSVLSAPATLTVLVPPTIITPPQSQTAELGTGVGFDVSATGDPPLFYRWFLNATNALGSASTNSHLQLANVQFSQSGAYTVVVTNGGGAVTSPPALLNVISVIERRPAAALNLTGVFDSPLNLDYTPLVDPPINWLPLDSVVLTNPAQQYVDVSSVLVPQRFYRGWQTNGPPSVLGLNMVPALTLTGAIGSSVRIDCINQFGPIDGWVTNLATVILTNTSQLYFDTSSIGQPPRLWRLVPLP